MTMLPQPQQGERGPTYIKAGLFKKPTQLVITAEPHASQFPNNVEVPCKIAGGDERPFAATLHVNSGSYRDLLANLGPDGAKWVGAVILVQDDPVLANAFRVGFIADGANAQRAEKALKGSK